MRQRWDSYEQLLIMGRSKPGMGAAPTLVGRRHLLLLQVVVVPCGCWQAVMVCLSFLVVPSWLFPLFLSNGFSFLLQIYLVGWLSYTWYMFLARVFFAVGIACSNHLACCVCNVYLCLVVCDHRARLSTAVAVRGIGTDTTAVRLYNVLDVNGCKYQHETK